MQPTCHNFGPPALRSKRRVAPMLRQIFRSQNFRGATLEEEGSKGKPWKKKVPTTSREWSQLTTMFGHPRRERNAARRPCFAKPSAFQTFTAQAGGSKFQWFVQAFRFRKRLKLPQTISEFPASALHTPKNTEKPLTASLKKRPKTSCLFLPEHHLTVSENYSKYSTFPKTRRNLARTHPKQQPLGNGGKTAKHHLNPGSDEAKTVLRRVAKWHLWNP